MSRRKASRMSAETRVAVEGFVPYCVRGEDREARDAVMEAVRPWVSGVPLDPTDAKRLLRAGAELALAAYLELGTLATEVVLHPDTVERLGVERNQHRTAGWRYETRRHLTRLGRAANSQWWPMEQRRIGRPGTAVPYSADTEAGLLLAGGLRCRPGQTSEAAAVLLSIGVGANGAEAALVTPDDVVSVDGDRLAVRIRGRHSRTVPIRSLYTELARRVVDAATGGSFFAASHVNAVYDAAQRIPAPGGDHLRFRRARTTWLQAHLAAGTDLAALRVLAGPVSANTLTDLIDMSAATLDAEAAMLAGLKA